jgi:hypothetical protein
MIDDEEVVVREPVTQPTEEKKESEDKPVVDQPSVRRRIR